MNMFSNEVGMSKFDYASCFRFVFWYTRKKEGDAKIRIPRVRLIYGRNKSRDRAELLSQAEIVCRGLADTGKPCNCTVEWLLREHHCCLELYICSVLCINWIVGSIRRKDSRAQSELEDDVERCTNSTIKDPLR